MLIGLIYGGKSGEHEVSINSAKGVYRPLCALGHQVVLIGITTEGLWFLQQGNCIHTTIQRDLPLCVVPGKGLYCNNEPIPLDAALAVTHGYGGEDGNLQGLCLLANIPLCGCDTVSSALGMHKDLSSKLFEQAGIPTVPSVLLTKKDIERMDMENLKQVLSAKLGPHLFVKPENSGSSLGVQALVNLDNDSLFQAIMEAHRYSERVLIQQLVQDMVEVECGLLDTSDRGLVVAGPGLVIDPAKQKQGFLSYEHKYGQVDTAHLQVPSLLPDELEQTIRTYAKLAFTAIKGEGYARVDFFVTQQKIFLNEINTSPGMTKTSHFPTLMQSLGYSMEQVLQILIDSALKKKVETDAYCYLPPGV